MKTFAVIVNGIVWNTIVADKVSNVKTLLVGLQKEYDSIVEVTNEAGSPQMGYEAYNDKFRQPQPSDAYVWDESTWGWVPKEPMPSDSLYSWNSKTETWQEVEIPVE
jgi:hypothetical protein